MFVLTFEAADAIDEAANHRGKQRDGTIVRPVDAPKLRLWIEEPERHAVKARTPVIRDILSDVAHAAENRSLLYHRFEVFPRARPLEPLSKALVANLPAAKQKIEVMRRIALARVGGHVTVSGGGNGTFQRQEQRAALPSWPRCGGVTSHLPTK